MKMVTPKTFTKFIRVASANQRKTRDSEAMVQRGHTRSWYVAADRVPWRERAGDELLGAAVMTQTQTRDRGQTPTISCITFRLAEPPLHADGSAAE